MKSATWNKALRSARVALVVAIGLLLMQMAQAQTFNVIHTFTGGADGTRPLTGLTVDRAGNLYGTTHGRFGGGTVYRLKRAGSGRVFEVLHQFTGSPDGSGPQGRVRFGLDGTLYGTTFWGGIESTCVVEGGGPGCGTVFKLSLPPTPCKSVSCPWTETVLHRFQGNDDGAFPSGDLTFDRQGNIYGTTTQGGVISGQCSGLSSDGCGTVYELVFSGGSWTHTVVYRFQGPGDNYADGVGPASGVILDNAGNLYGTTPFGGVGSGVVFELSPSGNNWIQSVLYSFLNGSDGATPWGGTIFDRSGNLYGATVAGGSGGGGTAYELTPSGGAWSFNVLYSLPGPGYSEGTNDPSLTRDASGNFYGTKISGGAYGYGSVFKLSPSSSGWIYTSLYDFTCGSDGGLPISNVLLDSDGNLYGTAPWGGDASCGNGDGVVWEITP